MNSNMSILKEKILPTAPSDLPVSFIYGGHRSLGGVKICGIPDSFNPVVTTELVGDVVNKTIYSGTNEDGICLKVECTTYADYPVAEYVAYITNTAETDSKIINEFSVFDRIISGEKPEITYGTGDTWEQRGYETHTEQLMERLILEPVGGTPCNGASPFVKLAFKDYTLRIAVGWLGKWKAYFEPKRHEEYGVYMRLGQSRCFMKLRPGETIRTPSVTFMAYSDEEDKGRNLWRKWFRNCIMPKVDGKPIPPMSVGGAAVPGYSEWCGAFEKQQIEAIEGLKNIDFMSDIWWVDAGWYECGGDWTNTGNWYPDPKRFPDGFHKIGEKCNEYGSRFLLWFEPERVIAGTKLYNEHPEFLLMNEGASMTQDSLLNYAIHECVDMTIDMIDGIIKEGGVRIYREDFNFNPEPYWIKHESIDRIGAIENAHVQGHLRLWDTLAERNPGLIFDICASGGRRNEMESLRRGVPLHYTDVGYGIHPIKQKQFRFLNEWTPYYRSHITDWRDENNCYFPGAKHNVEEFTYVCSLAPSMSISAGHNNSLPDIAKTFKKCWKTAAEIMLDGNYYPLTECRKSTKDFYAAQYELPDAGIGFIHVISNVDNEQDSCVLDFKSTDGKKYTFTDSFGTGKAEFEDDGKVKITMDKAQAFIKFYSFQ